MGISLEDYLANREPCSVCEENGDEHHCITALLSREDSCLLYNSILKNNNPHDDIDVYLLQNLREVSQPEKVLEYYVRSKAIVTHILNIQEELQPIWQKIYDDHVAAILRDLYADRKEEALVKIFTMVSSLEDEYGISLQR